MIIKLGITDFTVQNNYKSITNAEKVKEFKLNIKNQLSKKNLNIIEFAFSNAQEENYYGIFESDKAKIIRDEFLNQNQGDEFTVTIKQKNKGYF